MALSRILVGVLAILLLAGGSVAEARSQNESSGIILSPDLAPTLTSASAKPTQAEVDNFGWAMFVAFNWPALDGARGEPDPQKTFGSPGTVVWETWKSPNEVFYPDGAKPPPWPVYGTQIPRECYDIGARGDGTTPTVLTNTLVNRTNQAAGGSLTDQNGNLAYYSITFSRPVFEFIFKNGYYNIAGQDKMTAAVNYPVGTAEMKASWRILLSSEPEDVKRRFLRRTLYVYTPAIEKTPASCRLQELGLLGQHFNLKVNYPDKSVRWVMATFEQQDNVPPFGTPYQPGRDDAHSLPYSLFNKGCYDAGANCTYNQSTEQGRSPTTPTEAIRTVNFDPAAQTLNPQWQQSFQQAEPNSPWQYYQMVTTQYAGTPSQQPLGNPTPAYSANTTMETYVKQSSCLNCHYTAKNINTTIFADYSFMLAQACPKPLFGATGAMAKTSAVCTPKSAKANQ